MSIAPPPAQVAVGRSGAKVPPQGPEPDPALISETLRVLEVIKQLWARSPPLFSPSYMGLYMSRFFLLLPSSKGTVGNLKNETHSDLRKPQTLLPTDRPS